MAIILFANRCTGLELRSVKRSRKDSVLRCDDATFDIIKKVAIEQDRMHNSHGRVSNNAAVVAEGRIETHLEAGPGSLLSKKGRTDFIFELEDADGNKVEPGKFISIQFEKGSARTTDSEGVNMKVTATPAAGEV
eukprot:scaffold2936_cov113-Cylindrotheca_fusiformis.AAC.6